MLRLTRPRKGWGPLLVLAAVAMAGVVYLLTKHGALAMALTAVGTVGAAVAAAGSARQSAVSARESGSSARTARLSIAPPLRPMLKLSGDRQPDGTTRFLMELRGQGEYHDPRVEYLGVAGRVWSQPILDEPGDWERRQGFVTVDAGVDAVRLLVGERVTDTLWHYRVPLEEDAWAFTVGMELSDDGPRLG